MKVLTGLTCFGAAMTANQAGYGQITLLQDYKNYTSAPIGTYQGISFREAGFSTLFPIAGTDGKEFWTCSDRGVNVDGANANPLACRPTYDKIFVFPNYAPKIHRIKVTGDSIQVLRTITMKRPSGTSATGVLNPTGFGSTATEQGSTDTSADCASFSSKIAAKDIWSIDPEGLVVDKDGNFYISEENGPTIWKLNQNGVVIKRYTPYANLSGAQAQDSQIDTIFKYRKNNRGFESMAITPNGKIYTIIQSPLLNPNTATGENTMVHRILEIDPATNTQRMLVYLNEGVIGASGPNQIRRSDWKIGDMAAINDSTFLVIEAALRGTSDYKRIYKINISNATAVTSGLYGGQTVEALADAAGLAAQNIVPVQKTLFMDVNANGWPAALEKIEGIAIINDSTIAVNNDNDFGQACPAANGIPTATGNLSHIFRYGLQGANKLSNYNALEPTLLQGQTARNSSQAPYLTPMITGSNYTAIITAGDVAPNGYKMVGVPDGLGAFDNDNGTFTLVMNHELGNTSGAVRAHGSTGAFVSKWIINKSDLSVVSGADLIQTIKLWNPATNSYITYNGAFPTTAAALGRFCSADLPAVSALYNSVTGKGTLSRIFLNGEESGSEGRGFAHVVTGPEAGTSYELPSLGKFSWENALANPRSSDLTIVAGTDDATPGQVYFFVGNKGTTGNEIEKAGLADGTLYSVAVTGMLVESNSGVPAANTAFSMVSLGNVKNMTGSALNTNSNNAGITNFLRPEDGAWDPSHPNDFYFATTNAFNANSRLWKLHFNNLDSIQNGGTITAVLEGNEGQQMMDNITIDHSGKVLIVEDVGGNAHIGKIWQYDINTDQMTAIGRHDTTRFLNGSANFLTQDEEASGILDAQAILGPGKFLVVDQAHYGISGEVVEGGQLLVFNNPASANAVANMQVSGNAINIASGDNTPAVADNTDFGNVNTGTTLAKKFMVHNEGPGTLTISSAGLTGANTAAFVIDATFPMTIAANGMDSVMVEFTPAADGAATATLNLYNNDYVNGQYNFALKGNGVSPAINVKGNNVEIANGDATPGTANNTDFGTIENNTTVNKSFVIQNTGAGTLNVSAVTFSGAQAGEFSLVTPPAFPWTIPAGDSQTITVKFAPVATGIRTASINLASNDANDGAYMFALQGISTSGTGIDGVTAIEGGVKVYPNPARNEATLAMKLKRDQRMIISMFDIQGKEVIRAVDKVMKAGEQKIVLDLSGVEAGMYFIQIASDKQASRIKLVINR